MTYLSEVLADSPLAYYPMDETSGTTLVDASGNGRNGTYANAPTFGAAALLAGGGASSDFDGTNDYGDIAAGAGMNSAAFTIEAWLRPDVVNATQVFLSRWSSLPGESWNMQITAAGKFNAGLIDNGNTTRGLTSTTSPVVGGTYHVVLTSDGTTIRLYVNGTQEASVTATASNGGTHNLRVGAYNNGAAQYFYNGKMASFAPYGTALSAARILAHYSAGVGGAVAQSIVGTQAIETDVALAGSRVAGAVIVGARALETDLARAGSVVGAPPVTIVGTQAIETDVALAGSAAAASVVIVGNAATELSSGGGGSVRIMPPVTPAPLLAAGHSVVAASAFGAVTMQGSQPVYSISTAYTPRARQRIVVGGQDVTYFRGGITPNVTYTLLEPLLYGPATLDLPQVSAVFERPGVGALSFLRPGAEVIVQRVIDDVVVGTDYKGIIVAFDISGRTLSVEIGGEASGRAALRNRQVPIFPRTNDLGRQFSDVIRDLGLPFYPPLGPVTGIEAMTTGGTGHLEHIQALVAKAWTRAGKHWTIMPDETTGEYEAHRKDDETIHGTVFLNDAKTVANLRRDIAEEPNRVYITGVLKNGQRVRFGVYPGLIQGPTPPFPGHMQMGDTGDGVRLLIGKLHAMGYLKLTETAGGYDQDVYDAVVDLQIDAGLFDDGFTGTADPGEVNLVTWEALYDLGVTGNSLEWAHIEPAAQRRKVAPWKRSGNGGIMGVNPLYDPNHLVRDRNIDAGSGWENRSQLREFARAVLHDSDDANWVGDITFHTGALIRGDGFQGMTVTAANVMDARELRPGMNLDLPQFDGGTFVHISAIQVDESGIVTATVDTRFRDAMEVWEVIARNKESRNDPGRTRNQRHRSSTIVKDSIGEWDEFAGFLGNDIDLVPGWNTFEVVGAMEGVVARLRLRLNDPAEFACAVFGRSITADRLNNLVPAPLTNFGGKQWENKADELDERWLLYSAGTKDEPCGYSPGRKQERTYDEGTDEETTVTVNDPTGKHIDEAGFAYRSYNRTELTVAVWVGAENKIESQRIMWNQLEAGA